MAFMYRSVMHTNTKGLKLYATCTYPDLLLSSMFTILQLLF